MPVHTTEGRLRAHRALPILEPLFGPTLLYRLPDGSTVVCALSEVERIDVGHPNPVGAVRARLAAPAEGEGLAAVRPGDLVFALSHDLQWSLRDPGLPGPPEAARPAGCLALLATLDTVVTFGPNGEGPTAAGRLAGAAGDVLAGADLAMPPELRELAPDRSGPVPALTDVCHDLDEGAYAAAVQRIRRRMEAGDVYQVVLSTPVWVKTKLQLHDYFTAVAHRYLGSTYSYWLNAAGQHVFGNCSLPHVMTDRDHVWTSVFAGTGPVSDSAEDKAETLRRLAGEKYFSEHVMLVDLERNDLGMMSVADGVSVGELMAPIEVGPTTYLGTTVSAQLPRATTVADVVLSSFPRGVVVGAPKSRAQEVVAIAEGRSRGFYSGALGIVAAGTGAVVSNTVVTCATVEEDMLRLDVAGGLVHASEVDQELRELRLKLAYTT